MRKIILVLVNASASEAKRIGQAALNQRLIGCFDVLPGRKAEYFWPPNSSNRQTTKGVVLYMQTLPNKVRILRTLVATMHSDTLPFIGHFEVFVSSSYFHWLSVELSKK